ncbi:MAG: hypothetical protein ABI702_13065 [Burkholderiales bacterium]
MARLAATRGGTCAMKQLARWGLLAITMGASASSADDLHNWFDDPFFQVTAALPGCPLPAGPFTDENDRRVQAHRRAEKGTTCWLAKECDRPNAYVYDHDIAEALQAAWRERHPFAATTLWVTVQGRVVYIEGCATTESVATELESFVRSVPHVQQAIAIIRSDPAARPPYRVR